jgi:two-component system KDP operon response regulator KdpE
MTHPSPVIVVIEDDPQMRRFLRTSLGSQGFQVHEAETGRRGLVEAATRKPDVVIVDLGLPDMDGVEVVKGLRQWTQLPIIVLSARSIEQHKIEALDAGADDYLTKPFGIGELLARIRVALRHSGVNPDGAAGEVFAYDDIKVDLQRRQVFVGETEVHMTPIEYRLFSVLLKNAGKVLTHRQLLKDVWGPGYTENAHYLRIYMRQLRHKLEADPTQPRHLITESGIGYRLKL